MANGIVKFTLPVVSVFIIRLTFLNSRNKSKYTISTAGMTKLFKVSICSCTVISTVPPMEMNKTENQSVEIDVKYLYNNYISCLLV